MGKKAFAAAGVVVVIGAATLGVIAITGESSDGGGQEVASFDPNGETGAPDVRERVRAYTPEQRAVLRTHLNRALSRLDGPRTELAVAAAVNTYLHQYFLLKRFSGAGADSLLAGRGICGNHSAAMLEMLYLAGIDARSSVLLGIRSVAANHQMVEVGFSDGDSGLFDPTHGAFFYADDEPVGLEDLVEDPSLSEDSLQTDLADKRTSDDQRVTPMSSISTDYRPAGDAAEILAGQVSIRWARDFADNRGWGVSYSGRELVTPVPIAVGQTRGTTAAGERGDTDPWHELAVEELPDGRPLPLANVLGQDGAGYDTAHDFRLGGTRPGERYVLQLFATFVQGAPSEAQGKRARVEARTADGEVTTENLRVFVHRPERPRVERIDIPIAPDQPEPAVLVRARGYLLLQGIRLVRVSAAQRPL